MKCDQAQLLQTPYLDSELDARATLEVEAHLECCADCARLFAEARVMEAGVKAALNKGPRSAALWKGIERSVRTARASQGGLLAALGEQLQAGWRRSRWAWGALGAAWAVILGLSLSAPEPEGRLVAGTNVPSASEMRLAREQKQLLMAELAPAPEPPAAEKPKAATPAPRSQWLNSALNT